jgi:hypothetical protein
MLHDCKNISRTNNGMDMREISKWSLRWDDVYNIKSYMYLLPNLQFDVMGHSILGIKLCKMSVC